MTKQEIDDAIGRAVNRHLTERSIAARDLSKVTAAGKKAAAAGEDIDAAIMAALDKYATPRVEAPRGAKKLRFWAPGCEGLTETERACTIDLPLIRENARAIRMTQTLGTATFHGEEFEILTGFPVPLHIEVRRKGKPTYVMRIDTEQIIRRIVEHEQARAILGQS